MIGASGSAAAYASSSASESVRLVIERWHVPGVKERIESERFHEDNHLLNVVQRSLGEEGLKLNEICRCDLIKISRLQLGDCFPPIEADRVDDWRRREP